MLLNVHRFFIFDISGVFVEISIVSHAEEGVVEGEGGSEVELRDLEEFFLGADVPDAGLFEGTGHKGVFFDCLGQVYYVLAMSYQLTF